MASPPRATVWLRKERAAVDPVFVDASGRRRLLWRVVGVVVALLCLAFVALIVLAALSGSPTPLSPDAAGTPSSSGVVALVSTA